MRGVFKKVIVWLLTLEAKAVLRLYKPRIIAVTGSVGKTSTKDAIYSVLSPHLFVRKSEKSFNSEIGIPLTILGRPNAWSNPLQWAENLFDGLVPLLGRSRYPKWLVLEVGADRPGDISSVAKWLPVDLALITRLPDVPVHVEFFETPGDVLREKASLLNALKPDGVFIANADDSNVMGLRDRVPGQSTTFGFSIGSDIHARDLALLQGEESGDPIGVAATIQTEDGVQSEQIAIVGTIGTHAFLPILGAFAVGRVLGFSFGDMAKAVSNHVPPPGRMRLLPGIKGAQLIDDTYNSSPAAVSAALDALLLVKSAKRTIAVLGDMLELGKYAVKQHKDVGAKVAEVCDELITVGFRARDIADGALAAGMKEAHIHQFEDAYTAGNFLESMLKAGDLVLIKGSQSMRMERVVEEVMAEPQRARELLVRQEPEWRKR